MNGVRNSARSESAHSVAVLNALRNKKHKGVITMGLAEGIEALGYFFVLGINKRNRIGRSDS